MLDKELPLSPDKRVESAEMDLRSSVDLTCCHAIEGADPQCVSSVPALCAAVERASMPQSYVGLCAVEQACEFLSDIDFDDEPRPPTITLPARFLILEQEILSGRKCSAISWTLQLM